MDSSLPVTLATRPPWPPAGLLEPPPGPELTSLALLLSSSWVRLSTCNQGDMRKILALPSVRVTFHIFQNTSKASNEQLTTHLGLKLVSETQQLGVAEVDRVLGPHPGIPATVVTLPELDVPEQYDVTSNHPMTQ